MVRRRLIPFALILAANLFGQIGAQAPNQPQKPAVGGNCTVSGRVVSPADGLPPRLARVALVQADAPNHPQV
jgi:hypothetical protein